MNICNDNRCEVHLMLLEIRDGKDSWLQIYCPGNVACDDDGDLWSQMVKVKIFIITV